MTDNPKPPSPEDEQTLPLEDHGCGDEPTSSIVVNPSEPGYYWVRTIGPGSCDEAAVVSPTILFLDGFESGDTLRWSSVVR
jgi:hypothetical protein